MNIFPNHFLSNIGDTVDGKNPAPPTMPENHFSAP